MNKDTTNLYLAIGLSCLVIVGWSYFFAPKPARLTQAQYSAQQQNPTAPQDLRSQASHNQVSRNRA